MVKDLKLKLVQVEKMDMVIDCFVLPGTPKGTVMQSNALLEDVGRRGDISLVRNIKVFTSVVSNDTFECNKR